MIQIIAWVSLLASPQQEGHFKSLEWMIGTWEGGGKMDDLEFTARVTYEWTLNKNFIKTTFEAKSGGQVVWSDSGMIGWDPDKKKIVSFVFGLDGSIGNGEYGDAEEKDTWIATIKINSNDERFKDGRAIIRKKDADAYTEEIQSKKDGKWTTFMNCSYKRKKEKK